jgi:hypothetical protein
VTNTDTYGGLPARLRNEAANRNFDLTTKHIFLGRYISFHDEVTVPDIARAFESAIKDELQPLVASGERFACITHSTGGPVIREWWHRYYFTQPKSGQCPMSHLMMLAPANFGSALAQLGKGRLSRLKNWFGGTEPGQGVLDWLELGSADSWDLNTAWIKDGDKSINAKGVFPFVLSGQTIDRKFYDNLNSYTGEDSRYQAPAIKFKKLTVGPTTAMRIIKGASHSGSDRGIMRSVRRPAGHARRRQLVDSLFDCLSVATREDYRKVAAQQHEESRLVQEDERLETDKKILAADTHFIHDRYSMVVFRVTDDRDHPVTDFDLILTAGPDNDPDHLPKGFFLDRQLNRVSRNTVTYFFNYDIMVGAPEVNYKGKIVREETQGAKALGIRLRPRPADGFVHYLPCEIKAEKKILADILHPNATTLVDIQLRRVVHKNVFRVSRMQGDKPNKNFKNTRAGRDIVE